MPFALPDHPTDRLVRICGMLGSAHDGERAAAALLADRFVRDAGLTWEDVIRPAAPPASAEPAPRDLHDLIARCLARAEAFPLWERDFLCSLARFRRLSVRQRRVLARLAQRLRDAEGRA